MKRFVSLFPRVVSSGLVIAGEVDTQRSPAVPRMDRLNRNITVYHWMPCDQLNRYSGGPGLKGRIPAYLAERAQNGTGLGGHGLYAATDPSASCEFSAGKEGTPILWGETRSPGTRGCLIAIDLPAGLTLSRQPDNPPANFKIQTQAAYYQYAIFRLPHAKAWSWDMGVVLKPAALPRISYRLFTTDSLQVGMSLEAQNIAGHLRLTGGGQACLAYWKSGAPGPVRQNAGFDEWLKNVVSQDDFSKVLQPSILKETPDVKGRH